MSEMPLGYEGCHLRFWLINVYKIDDIAKRLYLNANNAAVGSMLD